MSEKEITERIDALIGSIGQLTSRINENQQSPDGGRKAAAEQGIVDYTAQIEAAKADLRAEQEAKIKAAIAEVRAPSMAAAIGQGPDPSKSVQPRFRGNVDVHPMVKASLDPATEYVAGDFISAIAAARSYDAEMQTWGKAKLTELGIPYGGIPELSKATLGATGATGGYVLPNNLVDQLIKPSTQQAIYQNLVTVRNGVNVRGVDLPYRTGAPARMQFQDWGATKENVNEAYGSYTATLGTIARIYDVGKQYLRFSAGSAEQDVIDELRKGAALGENYYIIAGAGTGSVGTGDPTVGVYTALAAVFGAYTTAHSASASTVAGSAAAGLAASFSALATRSRTPTAVVTDAVTYWTMFSQGSDNAGFWMSDLLGAGFQIGQDNSLRWRGVPILYDANFNTNTSTTKRAIVAEWDVFKLYRGLEFRVDTSDVAGNRWDTNLVGFRGEEEIGFNAYPGVFVGAAQLITGLIP